MNFAVVELESALRKPWVSVEVDIELESAIKIRNSAKGKEYVCRMDSHGYFRLQDKGRPCGQRVQNSILYKTDRCELIFEESKVILRNKELSMMVAEDVLDACCIRDFLVVSSSKESLRVFELCTLKFVKEFKIKCSIVRAVDRNCNVIQTDRNTFYHINC